MAGAAFGAIAGGILSSGASAGFSAAAAKEQRKFIKEMRKTAYQTTMEDMRKAGLNPILAYRQGPTTAAQAQQAMTPKFGQDMFSQFAQGSQAASAKGLRETQMLTESRRQNMLDAQAAQGYSAANLNDRNAEMLSTKLPAANTSREFDQTDTGKNAIKIRRALTGGSSAANAAARIIGR